MFTLPTFHIYQQSPLTASENSLQKLFPPARPLTKHLFQPSSGPALSSQIGFPQNHGLSCSREKEPNPSLRCGLFIRCCMMSCTFLILYLSAAALQWWVKGLIFGPGAGSPPYRACGELGECFPLLMWTFRVTTFICFIELCRG